MVEINISLVIRDLKIRGLWVLILYKLIFHF